MAGVPRNRRPATEQYKSINQIGIERRENADGEALSLGDDVLDDAELTDEGRARVEKAAEADQAEDGAMRDIDIAEELDKHDEQRRIEKEARGRDEPRSMTVDDVSLSPGGDEAETEQREAVTKEAQAHDDLREEVGALREQVEKMDDEEAVDDFETIRDLVEAGEWSEAARRFEEFSQWVNSQLTVNLSGDALDEIEQYAKANGIELD